MKNNNKINSQKTLQDIHKDLQTIYTLTKISQETLDLCCENEKDCRHITFLIDIILDKICFSLQDLKTLTKTK